MPTIVEKPLKLDDQTLKTLREGFLMDASLSEIAFSANISLQTLINWLNSFPDLKEELEGLRHKPKWRARHNVLKKLDSGDIETSKWYLERKAKSEFAQRTELTGSEGMPLGYIDAGTLKELETPKQAEIVEIKPEQIEAPKQDLTP